MTMAIAIGLHEDSDLEALMLYRPEYALNRILWRLAVADGLVSFEQTILDVDIEGLVQRAEKSLQRLQALYGAWDEIMED